MINEECPKFFCFVPDNKKETDKEPSFASRKLRTNAFFLSMCSLIFYVLGVRSLVLVVIFKDKPYVFAYCWFYTIVAMVLHKTSLQMAAESKKMK